MRSLEELLAKKDHKLSSKFERESKLISAANKGFSITGRKNLSVKNSRENLVIVSPSGGGKTSTIIYPSCFNIQSSMIINDPSGEIIKTKNYFISKGFNVKTLDFGNKTDSIYYNPLKRIKTNADVVKVASMLVRSTSKKGDFDFWNNKSVELIAMFINFILENEKPIYQNLGNVFHMLEVLQGSPETIDQLFAQKASEQLFQKYKSLIGTSDNTRSSIIASAQASLSFIGNDPTLCDITSTDNFDFGTLRNEKTILFLRCPLGDVGYFSTINSIFFEQFFSEVFSKIPDEKEDDIFILIDELSSLYLPNLANIISNSRKFQTPILGVLQSENQLYQNYGEFNAKTILNNANTKVYFTGLTDESNHLEKTLGRYEYEDEKGAIRSRALMTSDEIRTMPRKNILIIHSGMRPIKATVTPHYRQPRLMKLLNMETPENQQEEITNHSIQYLSFKQSNDEEE
jgi:type IV secretory pathway TraG/TraD family ATPase VirD4